MSLSLDGRIYCLTCLAQLMNLAPLCNNKITGTLRWRHNGHDGVSNHQPHDCLLNRLIGRRSKKTSKLCITGLCVGNSPGTGEFPVQISSNAENVSIWSSWSGDEYAHLLFITYWWLIAKVSLHLNTLASCIDYKYTEVAIPSYWPYVHHWLLSETIKLTNFSAASDENVINPLRAKFFRLNINIYLHFMSLFHINMTHVLKVLHQVRPRPTYST